MENLPGISRSKKPLPPPRKPDVVLQPQTYKDLVNGVNLIVEAIRPTLGPLPRLVALERAKRTESPEFLDDGATIARRIVQIIPRGSDVGAMLIRHALWMMHEEVGDGSTTMGVMYQAILNEGVRYVTQFGCNAMLLRSGLEKGRQAVLAALREDTVPLKGKDQITAIARGMSQGNSEMAEMLGEIFDIVGADGLIVVEKWNKPDLEREYIEGTYWHLSGWFSRLLVTDPARNRTLFEDAAILISDLAVQSPNQLVPVLEKCVKAGVKNLVIIAREFSDSAVGLLVNNNQAKTIQCLAVRTPRVGEMERVASMEDIAALAGGRIFYSAGKDTFDSFQVEDLGYARRAWATESLFGIYGGKGDPRRIRQHIADLRGMLRSSEDGFPREQLQQRLGRLAGGTAILRLGGMTETETETLKSVAERAVTGLRKAIQGGVVTGGGTALLNARSALAGLPAQHEEEAIAYRVLARALEEPMRAIAQNAGSQPDVIIEKIKDCPKGYGLDGRERRIVDMRQAGILDSVLVLEKALEVAVSGAGTALTTDVIVHHRKPKESLEP